MNWSGVAMKGVSKGQQPIYKNTFSSVTSKLFIKPTFEEESLTSYTTKHVSNKRWQEIRHVLYSVISDSDSNVCSYNDENVKPHQQFEVTKLETSCETFMSGSREKTYEKGCFICDIINYTHMAQINIYVRYDYLENEIITLKTLTKKKEISKVLQIMYNILFEDSNLIMSSA